MIGWYVLIVVMTFVLMEVVAWSAHKYLMHGPMWNLHEDHHNKDITSFFEKNDYFFLIFAIPGIACLAIGTAFSGVTEVLCIGIGITIYGFCYFLIHDVFIHQRFPWLRKADGPYFRAIKKAHRNHHKHLGRKDGECFGMLWVPMKYFKK